MIIEAPLQIVEGYEADNRYWTIIGHPMPNEEDGGMMGERLIAHDVIEHVNGWRNIGSVEDELEALGAVWISRGQWADLSRPSYGRYSPEEEIGFDVANTLSYAHSRPLAPLRTNSRDTPDEEFHEILKYAENDLKGEYFEGYSREEKAQCYDNLKNAIHWMRQGYRKMRRRFGGRFEANTMFWNTVDALKDAPRGDFYDTYRLCCDTETLQARVEIEEPEYDDYD